MHIIFWLPAKHFFFPPPVLQPTTDPTLPLHRQQLLDNSAFTALSILTLTTRSVPLYPRLLCSIIYLCTKINALMSLPYCIGTQSQRTLIVGPSSNRLRRCASTLGLSDNRLESAVYADASFRSRSYSKTTASGFRLGIGRHGERRYGK